MTYVPGDRQPPEGVPDRLVAIDICVCTYRRDSLRTTLRSIAAQTLRPDLKLSVIVADNDIAPSARDLVAQEAKALGLPVDYRHAPSRNISIARNACLDAGSAPLVAFIDDDEIADPTWLSQLLAALDEQKDVVFGPVRAIYEDDFPPWLAAADLHSMAPVVLADGHINTGYTSNCLMRRQAIGDLRFDLELGRSGGEDTQFFARLHAQGAKLGAAPKAVVREPVAPGRASLRWLWQRSFRSGQTHARLLALRQTSRLAGLASAAAKAVFCHASAVLHLASPVAWRRDLVRGALHLGVMARLLGLTDLELY